MPRRRSFERMAGTGGVPLGGPAVTVFQVVAGCSARVFVASGTSGGGTGRASGARTSAHTSRHSALPAAEGAAADAAALLRERGVVVGGVHVRSPTRRRRTRP